MRQALRHATGAALAARIVAGRHRHGGVAEQRGAVVRGGGRTGDALAQRAARERQRRRALAHAGRAMQQVGVGVPTARDDAAEELRHLGLADQTGKVHVEHGGECTPSPTVRRAGRKGVISATSSTD